MPHNSIRHGQVSFKTAKLTRGWAKLRFQCLLGASYFPGNQVTHTVTLLRNKSNEPPNPEKGLAEPKRKAIIGHFLLQNHTLILAIQTVRQSESSWFWYLIGSNSDQFCSSSFGIAFDIDGVVLRSEIPIGGSPQAIRRLYDDSGTLTFHAHLYYLFICLFNLGNCFVKVKL